VDRRIDDDPPKRVHMSTHHIEALQGDADPPNELCCSACGSLAFRYPRALDDDKPVKCAGCGSFVSTYGEIKRRLGEQD
jgi:hypothetical protein